jgi:hypothetical protein
VPRPPDYRLFLFSSTLLILPSLNRKSPKRGLNKMIISRKCIFHTVLLISLTIVTLIYGVTYLMDIEDANIYLKEINIDKYVRDINTLTTTENNNQICDSLTGQC